MPEDAIEDDAVDYSAAEQGYNRTASRTKFSIIISALIILLLLVFVFQIYRRLTADNKDASGLFQEATVYDPPLLLPSTPTEPTEPTTNPSKSSTTITSSTDAQLQMPTSSSSTTVSTVPSATTSSSHSIKVNTVPVTEVDFYGDGCEPCEALKPHILKLEETYGEKIRFTALNTSKARRVAISQQVMGLPNISIYKDGERVDELVKDQATPQAVEEMVKKYI